MLKILVFFLRKPTLKINQGALRKELKLAKATAVKWLDELVKADLLAVEHIGVSNLYQLNKENIFVKQLKILYSLIQLSKFKELGKKYNLQFYLYGSAARGEDVEESDVDLLIIGKEERKNLIKEIAAIAKTIGKEIKIEIFTPLQWSMMARKDKAFYERVEKDKIRLA